METDNFLINPFGLMYHEITASSLVKVDMLGQVVDPGTTTYSPNVAGLTLHSAIHHCRPDAKCIVHIHNADVVAVSEALYRSQNKPISPKTIAVVPCAFAVLFNLSKET